MSTRENTPLQPPVSSREELVAYIAEGEKPKADWRIGTEHEKFGFYTDSHAPVPYGGTRGVRALLMQMATQFDWDPVFEGGNVIALKQPGCPRGGAISLEPGGQFELSGAPLENVNHTCTEVHRHLAQVRVAGGALGIGFLGLGFSPKWTLDETPRMPKGRYDIMSAYMPKVGRHGLDMMFRTSTVQVNLDFSDEADMVKKFRVGIALQPLATALFANSPFTEGKPNGFLSYRSEIWRDVDNARAGMVPFVFEDGFGYEAYVDYALDTPMYFVYRDGRYIDASGQSFRDFLAGRLAALPGEKPTLDDWNDHLTTLFPEVRLKRFLEMRGADGGPWRRLCALPAFWTGLLYEQGPLDAAWDLVRDWTAEDRQAMRDAVPKLGLAAPTPSGPLREIASRALDLAKAGLAARARIDSHGQDERQYLQTLEEVVASGKSPAEMLLAEYHGAWGGDIDRVFDLHAY
jgi:glutamate--cysteine ligase